MHRAVAVPAPTEITVRAVHGLPEVSAGADLATLIADVAGPLRDGDILVVTSKIVSKAEGRVVRMPRERAIDAETVRVVARRGDARIVQTRQGLVLAAAGVDASNTTPGTVVLLPADPDASARSLRKGLSDLAGATVGVVVTDTLGRPWRDGQTDNAIGVAGLSPTIDHRGWTDTFGNPLEVTLTAVADEIAAAADLVKGKTSHVPVALVRGLAALVTGEDGRGARALVRPAAQDMFRFGAADVPLLPRTTQKFTDEPVDPTAVLRALSAALAATQPRSGDPEREEPSLDEPRADGSLSARSRSADAKNPAPWRFVAVRSARRRSALLAAAADDTLEGAPLLLVPCLVTGAAAGSEAPSDLAERDERVAALGAAVQNLLVAFAVDGLGGYWLTGSAFDRRAAAILDLPGHLLPFGAIGIGRPADPAALRPPPAPDGILLTR